MPTPNRPAKSILVVESNEVEREGVAALLRRQGHRVALAGDGEEALAYLRQQAAKPDLILLSMFLPRCDGWQFLHDHAAVWQPAPVVLVVAGLDGTTAEWAQSFGAKDVIHKPIVTADLLKKVEQHAG